MNYCICLSIFLSHSLSRPLFTHTHTHTHCCNVNREKQFFASSISTTERIVKYTNENEQDWLRPISKIVYSGKIVHPGLRDCVMTDISS